MIELEGYAISSGLEVIDNALGYSISAEWIMQQLTVLKMSILLCLAIQIQYRQ